MLEYKLLRVEAQEWKIEYQSDPVAVDQEQKCQECVYGCLGNDVGIESVAEVDRIDIVTMESSISTRDNSRSALRKQPRVQKTHHSRSLYMIVKKT